MYILGISAFYHDAAAALIKDGKVVAAVQEERFSRIKHDESFPINAIKYCLAHEHISVDDLEAVVFYEKPFLKFERLLETYLSFTPKGIVSFIKAISVWSKKKLFIKKIIKEELQNISGDKKAAYKILFSEHHLSHAASAYFTSPFSEAAILNIDAVGESATTSIFHANKNELTSLREVNFPHSVGLLYSAFTYYLGFKVNSGEYKLMGLAPYGDATAAETIAFKKIITEKLCTVFEDGSIFLQQQYFNYAVGLTMVNERQWNKLFSISKRKEADRITNSHCNLALAIQLVTEDIVVKLAREVKKITGSENLCMAGGVALNCVANGKLQAAGIFRNIYVQPAAGDAGGALGAALAAYHIFYGKEKPDHTNNVAGNYLGPEFSNEVIENSLKHYQATYELLMEENIYKTVSKYIDEGNVIGWFRGRMEFGPRALGNRSIIADPRNPAMQQKLNLKIKFRESYRPFAPAVRIEKAAEYFNMHAASSPYMLFVYAVKDFSKGSIATGKSMEEKLSCVKNSLPAITHVDGTARVQTVDASTNLSLYKLLTAFEARTGCGVLINTSFNVRGEPIVCTPTDALRCFMNTDMDVLVLNDFVLLKSEQKNTKPIEYIKELILKD
ncbi:carbamoyltransferase [soil metagenome]